MNKMAQQPPVQGPPAPATRPQQPVLDQSARQPAAQPAPHAQNKQVKQTKPAQPPQLSAALLEQIATVLRKGENPLAAQADLAQLHKRIVQMFTTLNEGLNETQARKAAADRTALTARIDQLEEAVNRMEGALRIEFEPVLKAAVGDALTQALPKPRRRWRGTAAALLLAAAALAAGVYWHVPLQETARNAAAALETRTGWQLPGGWN
ncbi:hypothetical protein AB838_22250 [Rhodobacteraceae bacterium (ex Bugula neritina AB1)]|nr:hypothetical protein AB838_22250 [Rhodobacteraceae bacterium (ex Bugula neritina AB1)]